MTGPVFPEDSWVEVRYPLTSEQEHADRAAWPWLPGWVISVCGPDEWEICVQAPELAIQHDGEGWRVIHSSYYRVFSDGNSGDWIGEMLSTFPQPKMNIY